MSSSCHLILCFGGVYSQTKCQINKITTQQLPHSDPWALRGGGPGNLGQLSTLPGLVIQPCTTVYNRNTHKKCDTVKHQSAMPRLPGNCLYRK